MCTNRKRPRSKQLQSPPPTNNQLPTNDDQLKRVKTESPTSVDRVGVEENQTQTQDSDEIATAAHRDEMVAAILTITSALGLSTETLHLCVGVLDRYLEKQSIEAVKLEALSISCLWIAVKFVETPTTIYDKSIKAILQRRTHSSNWTWSEILQFELEILQLLNFRVMTPTTLDMLQKRLYTLDNQVQAIDVLPFEQRQLALYFADLLLLKARAKQFTKELLVEAIWFVVSGNQIADVKPPLLEPVVLLYLAHRDNINPIHAVFKPWFALRCRYGAFLPSPWKVPYGPSCNCRICEHVQEELAS